MTVYFVSGFMRSGTSMMMRALTAGGLEPAYSHDRDKKMNEKWGEPDYLPNESYLELNRLDYLKPDFPDMYEGRLVKCLYAGMINIKPGQYRVIFMRRPQKEIQISLLAFFGRAHPKAHDPHLEIELDNAVAVLKDRRSILSVDVVDYKEVIRKPLPIFTRLRDNGWPIDPEKAAAIPMRNKRRFRVKENG